jgi:hypothetical protein
VASRYSCNACSGISNVGGYPRESGGPGCSSQQGSAALYSIWGSRNATECRQRESGLRDDIASILLHLGQPECNGMSTARVSALRDDSPGFQLRLLVRATIMHRCRHASSVLRDDSRYPMHSTLVSGAVRCFLHSTNRNASVHSTNRNASDALYSVGHARNRAALCLSECFRCTLLIQICPLHSTNRNTSAI